jgi:membrane-bound metal-dependent hydrolase YbcI (DUF457 family)
MPFTPFHFGPHTCVALPLQRYIDVPIFVGANVAIDIEPLLVILCGFGYPLHGYCHTFLFGSLVGLLLGLIAFPFRKRIGKVMSQLRLPHSTNLLKMAISGILGAWMHILFDMPLYQDIKPFYPLSANPLYDIVSEKAVYGTCALLFLPALVIYLYMVFVRRIRTETIS